MQNTIALIKAFDLDPGLQTIIGQTPNVFNANFFGDKIPIMSTTSSTILSGVHIIQ